MKRLSSLHLPRVITEISVTPLLDLMLVLLLAVIVLVPVLQKEAQDVASGRKVLIPEKDQRVELQVGDDLQLKLGGQLIEQQMLIPDLTRRVSSQPELGVVVRIPVTLSAPRLLQIMEALRSAGVKHTSVTTQPQSKS